MNWRRGLLRVWAASSMLWVAIVGFVAYPDVFYNYGLTKTRNTYDVTLPDGRAIKIISPTEVGSARLAENERKSASVAPSCEKGAETCDPWERQWDEGGRTPLPGAIITTTGLIAGPYSIVDNESYAEAEARLAGALKTAVLATVAPPGALGLLLLALAWVVSGFSRA